MNEFECVCSYLIDLQDCICVVIEVVDGWVWFIEDFWQCVEGGGGCICILCDGVVFEQVGIGFFDVFGICLLFLVLVNWLELVGVLWWVIGVLLVFYLFNFYLFIMYVNVCYFCVECDGEVVVLWFGGGFDLILFYLFDEDVQYWYWVVYDLCVLFGDECYVVYKCWCDEYFFLCYCNEMCGVGGLFFDDLYGDFECDFVYLCVVGDGFLDVYLLLVVCCKVMFYGECECEFQLYWCGCYVEFNLVYDCGMLFGLQSGGCSESILMSLLLCVCWEYGF